MQIEFGDVILRNMVESDVEDYVRWFTVEREWENWDAPWEKEDTDEQTQRSAWTRYYLSVKNSTGDSFCRRMEIEWKGRHVGWVSAYLIDEDHEWVGKVADGRNVYRAVGIDICEPDVWGRGVGTSALRAFVNYHFDDGVAEIYTQTWSGNMRMIRCAEKLGFAECDRKIDKREVDGQKYDGLTFRVTRRKWNMEKFILTRPTSEYAKQLEDYRQEFLNAGSSMDGCGPLRRIENIEEYIHICEDHENPEKVPAHLVPATQFLFVRKSDRRLVGMIQVRHRFNDYLEKYVGNIGYSVRPSERCKGYATQMLKMTLPFCREIGMERVLIACIEGNIGSEKTILANGGVYDSTVHEENANRDLKRFWITL